MNNTETATETVRTKRVFVVETEFGGVKNEAEIEASPEIGNVSISIGTEGRHYGLVSIWLDGDQIRVNILAPGKRRKSTILGAEE